MSQAVAGLIGVVVGGVLTGAFQYFLLRRQDRGEWRAAARLLRDAFFIAREHALTRNLSQIMLVYDFQVAVDEWREQRGALARALTNDEWSAVANAAALADSVAGKRSGELPVGRSAPGPEMLTGADLEAAVLDLLERRLGKAIFALERVASGRRFQRAVKGEAEDLVREDLEQPIRHRGQSA